MIDRNEQAYNFCDMQQASNSERHLCLNDSIKEFYSINKKLSKLSLRKEELVNTIISALGHDHEGQKTYEYETWKIEVKTPVVYSVNKKLYESIGINLPEKFNPFKSSITYTVDKRLCDQFMVDSNDDVKNILTQLVDKKPGKAGIAIKERV